MQVGFQHRTRLEQCIAVVKGKNKKGKDTESAIPYKEPYIDGQVVTIDHDGNGTVRCQFSGYVYSRNGDIDYRFRYSGPVKLTVRTANKKPEPKLITFPELLRNLTADLSRFGPDVTAAILTQAQTVVNEALAERKEHKIASHQRREEERKAA